MKTLVVVLFAVLLVSSSCASRKHTSNVLTTEDGKPITTEDGKPIKVN